MSVEQEAKALLASTRTELATLPQYPPDFQVTSVKVMRDLDKKCVLSALERDLEHFLLIWEP